MRVGLVTDTHIPDITSRLPPQVAAALSGVELILHAGDIYELCVLDELERVAPVLAALGDDDSFTLMQDRRVEMKHVLHLEGWTVWLMHEPPWLFRIPSYQADIHPAVVVHGHTHAAGIRRQDGVLFVGSGSPTFLHYRRGLGTVGILDITPEGVSAHIVEL